MHFKYIQEAGGTANGTTNTDRTNYFETLPSNYLETGLWLESDRMGYLLDDADEGEARQPARRRAATSGGRTTRIARTAWRPRRSSRTLYPPSHPYHHLTIGEHEDLERASVADVTAFFTKYYSPANATLAIAGDVDVATAKRLCQEYFGSLPSMRAAAARRQGAAGAGADGGEARGARGPRVARAPVRGVAIAADVRARRRRARPVGDDPRRQVGAALQAAGATTRGWRRASRWRSSRRRCRRSSRWS